MTKTCFTCKQILPLEEFTLLRSGKFGVDGKCRVCKNKKARQNSTQTHCRQRKSAYCKWYEHTLTGYLSKKYKTMRRRVQGKIPDHQLYKGMNLLPRATFYSWALKDSDFTKLFLQYRDSNWEYKLAPSIDRIDSYRGYELDNIRFITLSENSKRPKCYRKEAVK